MFGEWVGFWPESINAKRARDKCLECSIGNPDSPGAVFIAALLGNEKGVVAVSSSRSSKCLVQ
jgi:hypothetical protein